MRKKLIAVLSMVTILLCITCQYHRELGTVGMLTVVTSCASPEGCGPTYKLRDSNMETYIPLLGDINDENDQLIISVVGRWTELPEDEYHDINYDGPTVAIAVDAYAVLSRIKYHDFLVPEAREYAIRQYGCFIPWNKTFSWEMKNQRPILKVRMTETSSEETPQPFIELWYDGNTGAFIKEINNLSGYNPCD